MHAAHGWCQDSCRELAGCERASPQQTSIPGVHLQTGTHRLADLQLAWRRSRSLTARRRKNLTPCPARLTLPLRCKQTRCIKVQDFQKWLQISFPLLQTGPLKSAASTAARRHLWGLTRPLNSAPGPLAAAQRKLGRHPGGSIKPF